MDEPKQSIWKKEISLGRKPKEPKPAKAADPSSDEPKQSMWKKEISLKRKPKPEPVLEVAPEADTTVELPPAVAAVIAPAHEPVETSATPPAEPALVDLEWLTAGLDALAAADAASPVAEAPAQEPQPQPGLLYTTPSPRDS
jgi:hypothetical protein